MMADAGFVDDFDLATEFLITAFEDRRVLRHRHHRIRIAHHMDQRNTSLGQRRKAVNGITRKSTRLLFS